MLPSRCRRARRVSKGACNDLLPDAARASTRRCPPRSADFSARLSRSLQPPLTQELAEVCSGLLAAENRGLPVQAVRALPRECDCAPVQSAVFMHVGLDAGRCAELMAPTGLQVLTKKRDMLDAPGYTSILVALGRKERWDLAEQTLRWVRRALALWFTAAHLVCPLASRPPTVPSPRPQARSDGVEFRASHFISLAARRCEDKHYDEAIRAFSWMRECAVEPTGEAIEGLAYFIQAHGGCARDRCLLRPAA